MASVNKHGNLRAAMSGRALEKLKASNQAGKELTDEDMDAIGKELLESAVTSFQRELEKASPAEKILAQKSAGVIAEFFAGLKDGIESEIEVIKEERKQLAASAFSDDEKTDGNEELMGAVLDRLKEISENTKKNGLAREDVAPTPVGEGVAQASQTEAYKRKSADILSRDSEPSWRGKVPKAALAQQIAVSILGGIPGFGGASQKIVERIQQREEFISTESQLRSSKDENFSKLSEKEKRETLKEDFKVIQQEREKLRELEKQAESLRKRGYSEEDIDETLGVAKERQGIIDRIAERDTSRTKVPDAQDESGVYQTNTQKTFNSQKLLSAQHTTNITEGSETTANGQSSVEREEIATEQRVLTERAFDETEKQTGLLTDIRDILKLMSTSTTNANPTNTEAATVAPSTALPDIDLPDAPERRRAPKKGGRLSRIAKGAKGLFNKVGGVKAAGAALGVATGAFTGYQMYGSAEEKAEVALDEIKRKEDAGEITSVEAEKLRKEVSDTETEDKGGAVGAGAGIAAGSIMGAKAGMMIGAFGGPIGVAIGGAAGGIIGGIAGSSVGQNIGGAIGKGIVGVKDMLGFGSPSADDKPLDEATFSKANPELYKQFNEYRESRVSELVATGMSKGQAIQQATREATEKIVERNSSQVEKSAGHTTDKLLVDKSFVNQSTVLDTKDLVRDAIEQRNDVTKLQESSLRADTAKPPPVIVNAPPPTVISAPAGGGDTKVVPQPFFQRIRNQEPSLSDYLRARYA